MLNPQLLNKLINSPVKSLVKNEESLEKISIFISELLKWNKIHNLTNVTNINEIVEKHILDSLVLLDYIKEGVVFDIGSGAGFPGIVIAICNLELNLVLIESNRKKSIFLEHIVQTLNLKNVEVLNQRVENINLENLNKTPDWIVARAFASLLEICKKTQHLFTKTTKLLAMKSKKAQNEILELLNYRKDFTIEDNKSVCLHGLNCTRNLIFLTKKS